MSRLLIIHPFVPAYRRAFYGQVTDRLQNQGIDVRIVHNEPPPEPGSPRRLYRRRLD